MGFTQNILSSFIMRTSTSSPFLGLFLHSRHCSYFRVSFACNLLLTSPAVTCFCTWRHDCLGCCEKTRWRGAVGLTGSSVSSFEMYASTTSCDYLALNQTIQCTRRGSAGGNKTKPDKARRDKTDQTRRDQTRLNKIDQTRHDETRRDQTRQDQARQGKSRRDLTRQGKTRRNQTRQGKTRRDQAKQGKTRPGKTR